MYSNEEALEMQRRWLARQAEIEQQIREDHDRRLQIALSQQSQPGENLIHAGNSMMKIGCGLTALTWFGIPLAILFIAIIASLLGYGD